MAQFQGTDGNDSILRNLLSAGVTSDPAATGTLTGENNYIDGGAGNDTIEAGDGVFGDGDEVHGGAGRDTITGGGSYDYIYGEGGNDTFWGGEGASGDFLDGGSGDDVIHAADGFSVIVGGAGADTMYGGAGDAQFDVDNAGDRVIQASNIGEQSVFATIARYTLPTNVENLFFDDYSGTAQTGIGNGLDNQIAASSDGDARLYGKGGNDELGSEAGDDRLYGGAGNDTLYAGKGADRLFGGSGGDTMYGGEGADRMVGGTGHDVFIFIDVSDSPASQRDVIAAGDGAIAFEGAGRAAGDLIDLRYLDADLTMSDQQHLTFGGTGKGHLSLADVGSDTLVRGNLDDDASFEFQVLIQDGKVHASAYTADDFLLA